MDLVYECFVKLGLRYICVLRDGRYAGMVGFLFSISLPPYPCSPSYVSGMAILGMWVQWLMIMSRRIRRRLSSTCGSWRRRRAICEIGWRILGLGCGMTFCYGGRDRRIIHSRDETGEAKRGETCMHPRLTAAVLFFIFSLICLAYMGFLC